MNRLSRFTPFARLAAILALVLTACTGTTGLQPDVLLIVGYQGAAGGRVALVRADTLCRGPSPACQQQAILPGSERPLPAPPVAYDLANRPQARDTLLVLSREGSVLNGPAFLSMFATGDIGLNDPAGFAEVRPPLALAALERAPALAAAEIDLCPSRLQVSATGRFAAVLNDGRGVCASASALNSVMLIDLEPGAEQPPRLVGLFDDNVLPGGLFVSQSFGGASDRLLWLQDRGDTRVLEVALPLPASAQPRVVADIDRSLIDPVVDLGGVGAAVGGSLIALRPRDFLAITGLPDNPELAEPVETVLTNARRLVSQETGRLPSLILIGNDRVAIHLDQDDPEPAQASLPGVVGGTIDEASFAYFVAAPAAPGEPGAIGVFDFVFYDPAQGAPRIEPFEIAGMGEPAFISWILARQGLPTTR